MEVCALEHEDSEQHQQREAIESSALSHRVMNRRRRRAREVCALPNPDEPPIPHGLINCTTRPSGTTEFGVREPLQNG
jgi:hypothetical protein